MVLNEVVIVWEGYTFVCFWGDYTGFWKIKLVTDCGDGK